LSASDVLQVYQDSEPTPVLSSVRVAGVSPSGATMAWSTNVPADSQVEYGPTAAYGSSTIVNTGLVFSHAQTLSGLAHGTLYHYRVKSRNAAGTLTVSGDFTFIFRSGRRLVRSQP